MGRNKTCQTELLTDCPKRISLNSTLTENLLPPRNLLLRGSGLRVLQVGLTGCEYTVGRRYEHYAGILAGGGGIFLVIEAFCLSVWGIFSNLPKSSAVLSYSLETSCRIYLYKHFAASKIISTFASKKGSMLHEVLILLERSVVLVVPFFFYTPFLWTQPGWTSNVCMG